MLIGGLTDVAMALLLLPCVGGAATLLLFIVTGFHGASLGNLGLPLALLVWGAASAVAVMRRRAWGRNAFVAWAVASSVGLILSGASHTFDWLQILVAVGVVLVSAVAVVLTYVDRARVRMASYTQGDEG